MPLVPLQLVREVDHAREADHSGGVRLKVILIADGPMVSRAVVELAYALAVGQAPAIC